MTVMLKSRSRTNGVGFVHCMFLEQDAVEELQVCKRATKLLLQMPSANHIQQAVIKVISRFIDYPTFDLLHSRNTESTSRRRECCHGQSPFNILAEDETVIMS